MAFVLIFSVAAGLSLFAVVALWWQTRARNRLHPAPERAEPVTVLKPLCGADDALESNLASFFLLEHPAYELVFGVQGEHDPAGQVVRRLRELHPNVRCRLVIHTGGRGLNPKVDNLRAMLEHGSHDLVVVSDSNVAVRPDYLTALQDSFSAPGVGLVTSPIVGVGERSLGAVLENLQLAGTIAGSVAASALMGRTLVVGKSMMFRRSVLERLGGLGAVANLLAEDYVIGRMFRLAGYRVRLSPQPVLNVVQTATLAGFIRRHLRWSMLRTRLKPLAYPLEPLANPLTLAVLAPWLGMGAWPVWLGVGLSMARDGLCWLRLRGPRGLAAALPWSPVKDLLLLLIWVTAPFRRHVGWRGNRLRLSAGTWLYAEHPMSEPSPARCER